MRSLAWQFYFLWIHLAISESSSHAATTNLDDYCFARKASLKYEAVKLNLESQWRNGLQNLTILFGHIHHAGGTVVCSNARKLTTCNPNNNCHHPDEFDRFRTPPTRGSKEEQLKFQREVPWRFYSVEKKMPSELILHGPFIYMIIFRHPYYLTISNYLRQRNLKGYSGTLKEYLTTTHHPLSSAGYFDTYHSFLEYLAIDTPSIIPSSKIYSLFSTSYSANLRAKLLRKAYRKLDKFSIILLTDDMGQSSEMLRHKLNWDVEGFNIHQSPNMSRADQIHRNSQGPLEKLYDYLRYNLTMEEKKLFQQTLRNDLEIFRYARCTVQWQLHSLSLPALPDYHSKFGHLEDDFM